MASKTPFTSVPGYSQDGPRNFLWNKSTQTLAPSCVCFSYVPNMGKTYITSNNGASLQENNGI